MDMLRFHKFTIGAGPSLAQLDCISTCRAVSDLGHGYHVSLEQGGLKSARQIFQHMSTEQQPAAIHRT